MKIDVLLGIQWGDEGKGKVVDVLTPNYDIIARFQGGPNAGHSLEFGNIRHVLHSIPSGIFHEEKINIIGNGVVIDPIIFQNEVADLQKLGVDVRRNLFISRKAHLILPSHRILDAASEASKGKTKIGSTLKGIGPTYMDKIGRNGLRIGDILRPDFPDLYTFLINKHRNLLRQYDFSYHLEEEEEKWFEAIEELKTFQLIDSEYFINQALCEGKKILAEGAQGTLLDIDFGTYPFVTSSNTTTAGACTGLGIPPNVIGEVFGIAKAYCTRVGSGPFPTELFDETGNQIREYGNEFGATTGRPRRCGWLDLLALKYAIMINGVTQLIITKADVLNFFDEIKVGMHYQFEDNDITEFPFHLSDKLKPVFQSFKGWKIENYSKNLPSKLNEYIEFLEKETKIPVSMVSTGANREAMIFRK